MKTILWIASLAVLFVSCTQNEKIYSERTTDRSDQDADWQITSRVKAAIMSDSSISSNSHVSVETTNGVVTLTGNVPSKEESRYIERQVKGIRGVRKVNNQLNINP